MTFNDLCKKYGTASDAARALGISRQTLQNWKKRGRIPFEAQFRIQLKTNARLKADTAALLKS